MKEKIKLLLDIFARISASIFLFSSIYISLFWGVQTDINLSYIWGVLFISLAATIVRIPFFSDKEISKTKMLVYNVLYFLFVNILVLVIGYKLEWFYLNERKMLWGIEITIIVVYICVMVISYMFDYQIAEKMNEKLKNRLKETD